MHIIEVVPVDNSNTWLLLIFGAIIVAIVWIQNYSLIAHILLTCTVTALIVGAMWFRANCVIVPQTIRATIDSTVPFVEVYSKYDILYETNGIYTMREKQ